MEPSPPLAPPSRALVMFALLAGVAMSSLDSAIANIALPTIAGELRASEAATVWVVNAFQLGTALFLLPAAALGEIRGLRLVYVSGLVAFGVASLACALAPSLAALVAFRFLQGAAGAFMAALAPAIIRRIQPPARIGGALALVALTVAFSGAAGPSVAAAILSVARWPWLFLVNVPICVVAAALFLRRAPPDEPQPRRFDRGGALLSALALALLVVGVDTLAVHAWAAAAQIAAGLAAFAWLVAHQARQPAPLVPLDLMRLPLFSLSVATSVCSYAAQILAYVSLPFLFQTVQHRSPVETGLLVTPWPLLVVVAAPVAGRLVARYPAALLGSLGLAALASGLALLAALPAAPSAFDIAWRMALCGVGFGFFQTPNNTTLMTAGPARRAGRLVPGLGARRRGVRAGARAAHRGLPVAGVRLRGLRRRRRRVAPRSTPGGRTRLKAPPRLTWIRRRSIRAARHRRFMERRHAGATVTPEGLRT